MKPTKTSLASIFSQIQESANAVEGVASKILSFVAKAKAESVNDFNGHVSAAYAALGWSQLSGRPRLGSELVPAPRAVKLYVSCVRRAYQMDLPVSQFKTMHELRMAIMGTTRPPTNPPAALRGLVLKNTERLSGDVWHDVIVVTQHLPEDKQQEIEAKVWRLVRQYLKETPALRLVG